MYRSNQHVYVQVIDDENQKTIAALGTMSASVKAVIGSEEWKGKTVESAEQVGKMLGAVCVEKGITQAVFDRGGFLYHGRVKAIADGARAGLDRRASRARLDRARRCCLDHIHLHFVIVNC